MVMNVSNNKQGDTAGEDPWHRGGCQILHERFSSVKLWDSKVAALKN